MMRKSNIFDDKSVLATPTPIHSSSMSVDKQKTGKKGNRQLENSIDRISDADSSLGILSLKNLDTSCDNQIKAAERLQRERILAVNSLNRCDNNFTSLPSRFLKPSELTVDSPKGSHSDSTISESDLIPPANSSTPRSSLLSDLSNLELVMRERQSRGSIITKLALSINDEEDFGKVLDNICKTIEPELSFCPGEEALDQLEQDEMSWKRKNDIPTTLQEFSVGQPSELKMSMGSFFQQRSDNVSELLAKSPVKNREPVPLIESSSCNISSDSNASELSDSLSISAIAQILSDTKQTPTRAMNFFMHNNKRSKSPKVNVSSTYFQTDEEITNKETEKFEVSLEKADGCIKEATFMNPPKFMSSPTFMISPTLETDEKEFKEAINEESKENVNILNVREEELSPDFNRDKSVLSSRSSSSLSSLPNGKLPVATTKTELIWGCVKPGKNVSQDFIMKNKSSSRIGVKCSISHPSFKLIKDGSDVNFSSTLKVLLHPYESRTVTVTFAPTISGAAVDNIYFTPINPTQTQTVKQFVRLFGYGGYGNITFVNVVKDTAGKFLLSLGYIENQEVIKKTFIIKNNGTLPSFAYVGFVSNGLYLFSNVSVSPQTLVLLPEEKKEVTVTYTPNKEDRSYLQSKMNSCVIDIGKLTVIFGTEVDRGRLRKLYMKAKEKGLEINAAFENIVKEFTGEVMPNDLKLLREPISGLDEILKLINMKEIVITLEQDLDRTLIEQFQNETATFHSLCENTKVEIPESTIRADIYNVEPSKIILTPPGKSHDMIFLNNGNKKKIYFEVSSTPQGLHLKPTNGTVPPGEIVLINVLYTDKCKGKTAFKVKVLVDNESYEVDVKVIYLVSKIR